MTIDVSSDFDAGGGADFQFYPSRNHLDITLTDEYFFRKGYFLVKLEGVRDETVSFEITNPGESYHEPELNLAYTPDVRDHMAWERMPEEIGGGCEHTFDRDTVWVSTVCAYPYQNSVALANRVAETEYGEVDVIGQSAEGRDMHAIRVQDPDVDPANTADVITTTRQHPSEVQGSHHMEAIIDRVLTVLDTAVVSFDRDYTFHFVPCANPDGVYHAYHRHTPDGVNLNRRWQNESPVEIANLKDYFRQNTTDVQWGFDLHAAYSPDYGWSAGYYESAPSSAELSTIEDISAQMLSFAGTNSTTDDTWKSSWTYTEFSATDVTTEVWQYYGYTPEQLQTEGRNIFDVAFPTPTPSATTYVRENGQWSES